MQSPAKTCPKIEPTITIAGIFYSAEKPKT